MTYFSSPPTIVSSNRILYTASPFARSSLLHLQEIGELTALKPHTSSRSNLSSYLFFIVISGEGVLQYNGKTYQMGEKSIDKDKANEDFRKAFWALRNKNGNDPSVEEMKTYLGVTQKTIYVRAKSMPDFYVKNAAVHAMISPQEEDGEQGRTEKDASNTPGITVDEDLLPWDAVIEDGDEEE